MNELALFAGAGGGILGGKLLGWRTVCAVEFNPYRIGRLLDRQRDGHLERFPVWDDIRTFDGQPWAGHVDIITGGFPCQDISSAGTGKGLAGSRSGLWFEMLRVIGEVRPPFVLAENSQQLRTRGLGTILKGLDGLGYDARWGVLGAWHVGANHRRNRMWIVANHKSLRCGQGGTGRFVTGGSGKPQQAFQAAISPNSNSVRRLQQERSIEAFGGRPGDSDEAIFAYVPKRRCKRERGETYRRRETEDVPGERNRETASNPHGVTDDRSWWDVDSFSGVDDGVADRVERARATGDGQIPAVVALAWRILGPNE